MMPVLAVLLRHGMDMDLIYFWSAIVMVLLPLGSFCWLTYWFIKRYRIEMRERGEGRGT